MKIPALPHSYWRSLCYNFKSNHILKQSCQLIGRNIANNDVTKHCGWMNRFHTFSLSNDNRCKLHVSHYWLLTTLSFFPIANNTYYLLGPINYGCMLLVQFSNIQVIVFRKLWNECVYMLTDKNTCLAHVHIDTGNSCEMNEQNTLPWITFN